MRGWSAACRAELADLARQPLTWTAAVAVGAAAWIFGAHAPFRENGYVVFEAALQPAAKVASFFLLGIASVAVAGERTRGTVRWILPRPLSRMAFVLGKAGAHALLCFLLLFVAVGTSWAVAAGHGFGDVVADSGGGAADGFNFVEEEEVPPEFQAGTMRHRTVIAALLVLPALLSATGIGLLVSSLLGSAAGAVIVSIGVALPLYYLPEVINLPTEAATVLPFRAATDFLGQILEFGRRLATARWPEYGLGAAAGALLGVFGLPLLAAWFFSRIDLTE